MPKALQRHENVQKQNLIHKTQWVELDSTLAFKSRPCFSIQKWKYVHIKLISTQIMMKQRYLYLKDFLDNRKLCACAHDADVDSYWTRFFFYFSFLYVPFLGYGMIITLNTIQYGTDCLLQIQTEALVAVDNSLVSLWSLLLAANYLFLIDQKRIPRYSQPWAKSYLYFRHVTCRRPKHKIAAVVASVVIVCPTLWPARLFPLLYVSEKYND